MQASWPPPSGNSGRGEGGKAGGGAQRGDLSSYWLPPGPAPITWSPSRRTRRRLLVNMAAASPPLPLPGKVAAAAAAVDTTAESAAVREPELRRPTFPPQWREAWETECWEGRRRQRELPWGRLSGLAGRRRWGEGCWPGGLEPGARSPDWALNPRTPTSKPPSALAWAAGVTDLAPTCILSAVVVWVAVLEVGNPIFFSLLFPLSQMPDERNQPVILMRVFASATIAAPLKPEIPFSPILGPLSRPPCYLICFQLCGIFFLF